MQDWLGSHRANLSGAITVLDAARERRIPVVYASSAAVYGDNAALPLTEDAATRPLSAYGADKLGCELHARVAGTYGVPTLGLRFFNVFGPRQDPRSPYSGVISIFCDRLTRGEAVEVYGDGEQTRDFVYVTDVVAALLAGLRGAGPAAPVFNVCTGRPISVRILAETIAAVSGVPLELRHRPSRMGEIRHSLGAAGRGVEALGLGTPVGLRDGLAEVVAWLRAGRPSLAAGAMPGP